MEDAAADLGAPPARVLRTIVLPDLAPGIWAAALLTFLFSFDDVVLSRLLSSPDTPTLPVTVLSLISRRPSPEIDAIGTVVMAVGLVVIRRRGSHRPRGSRGRAEQARGAGAR